jgi:polyether ionophore transport system permease protein
MAWQPPDGVLIGSVVMLVAAGLGFGIAGALSMSDGAVVGRLLGAALAYLPALWLTAGVAVLLVGIAPRVAQLAWVVPLYGFLVGYLGRSSSSPPG